MIRNLIFKIGLIIWIGFSTFNATAQQVNTLYFMENVPIRHNFNPAFQPYNDFYLGLPILGNTQLGIGNNSITLKDLIYKQNGKSILFLNQNADKNKFYNTLKATTAIHYDIDINFLDFGFRKGKGYWSFALTHKINREIAVPKDLIKLLLYQTPQIDHNAFNFQTLGANATTYTEAALGHSQSINDKWSAGAKLKFLFGHFNVSSSNTNMNLTANIDQWTLKGTNRINYSSPLPAKITNDILAINYGSPTSASEWTKPSGFGAGVDLGFTYKPMNELTLSGALIDLGYIRWNKNVSNFTNTIDYKFEGLGNFNAETNTDFQELLDTALNALKNSHTSVKTANAYTTHTSPKLNIGAEYSFFDNKLSVGLLSQTIKRNKSYFEELTASVNGRPTNWFNMSLSYSVLNGRMSNLGAGIGLRTGLVNWFVSADYLPLYYANLPISSTTKTYNLPTAYNAKGINFAIGVNIVLGNRRDSDHDGVIDKKDECPETPFSVVVDSKGCPFDTDGDGVPDYLDKCAKTPPEAYNRIDQDGCPVDSDGDGVPDYKDKCPDTPIEAIAFVDSTGCTSDTDKDGVLDYKDKCPNTALDIKVDSVGCPLDSDSDGVPDYKDKCPDTPILSRQSVDSIGCSLDTDLDSVPDYLDKCPNTPAEERKFVDENGCTVVKTKISNVTKKNESTSTDSKTNINNIDSDGDGVPDHRDKCPKVRGPVSNQGCPEVKKELLNLFRKALQGIQFETAQYRIMPVSYKILNQIAGVLIANPTYMVEIRGHTDNAGKSAVNLTLSTNRSKAVMNFLINKGIAAERMTAMGFGDLLPVATNKTAAGKATNRRVEFVVSYHEITFD